MTLNSRNLTKGNFKHKGNCWHLLLCVCVCVLRMWMCVCLYGQTGWGCISSKKICHFFGQTMRCWSFETILHSNCYLFYLFEFRDPYKSEKKFFQLWGLWYSKRPAWTHGFNAKINFEIYAPSPEILAKKFPNLAFQAKYQKSLTFLSTAKNLVHIIKKRFLRWNCGFKPVVLSTITPIIGRFFFRT